MEKRVDELYERLGKCDICPRNCQVDRLKGEKGYCKSGLGLRVSSFFPHFGEEPPLVGTRGSGTIFLSYCSLRCVFCQNYKISIFNEGEDVTTENAAKMMLMLQDQGCHNINLVTPTHYTPQLLKSIYIATDSGLKLPIVWNCGGYESLKTLKMLNGIVDIYMPDFKYYSSEISRRYSDAPDYYKQCAEALKEMHDQVGDLIIKDGVATRGVLFRHLVLPGLIEDSKRILEYISGLSRNSYVNIMSQYRPEYMAHNYSGINRKPSSEELEEIRAHAKMLGLYRGF